ncbi:calmodulin-binding protein 60 F-like isoform X4 [Syzygium oleosum]|uniref:calmodulin-binding protein 60 F-like isoform X4 n=1 Tax=Syzygium oleosum TaxID=219896 RepID=UPI0024BADD8C|nr:calmodulin-binding protein 60 F-like isoform X4 [Syzygium oleosum]
MAKRASASSSSGQPSQPKRQCLVPTGQVWSGSERNLVPGSCSTEEDGQRVSGEEPERAKSDPVEYCQSCTGNALKDIVQLIHSMEKRMHSKIHSMEKRMHSMENSIQKLTETVELANIHSPHLGRVNARSTGINDVRNLRLQFQTKLSDTLFTGKKLQGDGGARISVALIDVNTRDVVTSGPESSIKSDVVVLEGDFNKDDEDNWAHEEFENYVVKERERKGLLLTGDLQVTLKGGVGELGELIFTDNSSWNRSKRFRIGLKVALGYCGNTRIREAITDAFRVKEHRGESSKKHDSPAFDDEIWRLKMIAKDGKYHQKLSEAGIQKVGDFLLQLFMDPTKLKEILGMGSNSTNWDTLENHAKSCKTNWKLYLYYADGTRKHGAVFNTDRQLIGLIKDGVYCATHRLSADDQEQRDTIVKNAFDNWNDVMEFNGESFSCSMQKKSSSSFPSQALQIENFPPVQCKLTPRIGAAPGGPEAPPSNGGFNAEGHNGTIALASPVQLKNTNSGNAMKLSVDESVHLAAQQPISTDPLNVPTPQGDNGISTVGLPIQSHGNNFQYAMPSHTIHSSSQMNYTVSENVSPSEPPSAAISISQSSSTLPHPQGNHVVEGYESIDSDDILGNLWSDNPAYDIWSFLGNPLYDGGSVRGTGKGVSGWLKIKAVMLWGIFIRKIVMKRRGIIVQLDEPRIEV